MKDKLVVALLALVLPVASVSRAGDPTGVQAAGAAAGEPQVLGQAFGEAQVVSISELSANPGDYVGRTIRVEGVVTDVCPMAGCWVDLAGDKAGSKVHVKVDDGVIVFPKDAKGKRATVQGVFTRIERSRDEALASAKHLAEEKGQPFDPVKAELATVTYQIQGTGAVIR